MAPASRRQPWARSRPRRRSTRRVAGSERCGLRARGRHDRTGAERSPARCRSTARMIRDRFDVLREHGFRLLFAATTITTLGDAVAAIALAFAVLDVGSATALGIVLGV